MNINEQSLTYRKYGQPMVIFIDHIDHITHHCGPIVIHDKIHESTYGSGYPDLAFQFPSTVSFGFGKADDDGGSISCHGPPEM